MLSGAKIWIDPLMLFANAVFLCLHMLWRLFQSLKMKALVIEDLINFLSYLMFQSNHWESQS